MYFPKNIPYIFIAIIVFHSHSHVHSLENDTQASPIRNISHAKILKNINRPESSEDRALKSIPNESDDNNAALKRGTNISEALNNSQNPLEPVAVAKIGDNNNTIKKDLNKQNNGTKVNEKDATENVIKSSETSNVPVVDNSTQNPITHNTTTTNDKSSSSGAKRRAFIVFGSLGIFSFIYFVYKMYRRRRKNGDISFIYDTGDLQQFKYGMLLSNEAGDNVEMLAADSNELNNDSDDDEELELFDLERRKQFQANDYRDMHANDRLLAKDVDILDIELPGVRSSTDPLNDNDLLNLDDAVDEILRKPTNQNSAGGDKKFKNDDFFDVL